MNDTEKYNIDKSLNKHIINIVKILFLIYNLWNSKMVIPDKVVLQVILIFKNDYLDSKFRIEISNFGISKLYERYSYQQFRDYILVPIKK